MKNAYETGGRKNIPAVLIYAFCGDEVLMIHKNDPTRTQDFHAGKWNGLGGKCEPDESPLEAAVREFQEESGVQLMPAAFRPLGVVQFPNFKPHKSEDWTCYLFAVEFPESRKKLLIHKGEEGELHWVKRHEILKLNLWPGDALFLPRVLEQKPLLGTIWYEEGKVVRSWIEEISSPRWE